MSLRYDDIDEVRTIAAEVITLCDRLDEWRSEGTGGKAHPFNTPTLHTAALRRRSLDLTRALARLRNPWRPT